MKPISAAIICMFVAIFSSFTGAFVVIVASWKKARPGKVAK